MYLDIRFEKNDDNISVLVETKPKKLTEKAQQQLFDYVALEKEHRPNNNIVAILAATENDNVRVWYINKDETEYTESSDEVLKTMEEYIDYFRPKIENDKESVVINTLALNKKLYEIGVGESLRSQFVGSCLLALKNDLFYQKGIDTELILTGIGIILNKLLQNKPNNEERLRILKNNVLDDPDIKRIKNEDMVSLLNYIRDKILPYINDESNEGQDLLSLFFTTFNKYVGKDDKNQAFTPNHIAHFMCEVARINRNTHVLDPTCGSGTFLVQAMTMALKDCQTEQEKNTVKSEHIFGIEIEDRAYGLATTNMLIHGDGNSNIVHKSCFDLTIKEWVKDAKIQVVLMNPPFNASKSKFPNHFADTWGKSADDPSDGFYFVYNIAKLVKENNGILVTLLPFSCAIGNSTIINDYKKKMLEEHTLDAVFSLPPDVFYPGAAATACCMVFSLNQRHPNDHRTFFGYFKDDGFKTQKKAGRVDINNRWSGIEKEWLYLYRNKIEKTGMSVMRHVSWKDEWLAESYMETDYSSLNKSFFQQKINSFLAYKLLNWTKYTIDNFISISNAQNIQVPLSNTENWKWFYYDEIFDIKTGFYNKKPEKDDNYDDETRNIPFISAIDSNNGISEYFNRYDIKNSSRMGNGINQDISQKLYLGNCITISNDGSSICYAFFQDRECFTCSHSITVLYLKSYTLNKYIAMFLCTLIEIERYRWNYGRKLRAKRIAKSRIKLPVTDNGSPDWQYMEDYIKSLPYGDCI